MNTNKLFRRLITLVLFALFALLINFPSAGNKAQAHAEIPLPSGPEIPGTSHPTSADGLNGKWIYLPLTIRNFPITPQPPVLNPISNADGDGSYSVSWNAVEGADTYLLQEDDNAGFSSPISAYEGAANVKNFSGKAVGTYYYRVSAANLHAGSEWSSLASVVVSVQAPPCPQTGSWRGLTGQSRTVEFIVSDTPVCQIAAGSLKVSYSITLCGSATTTFLSAFSITANTFSASSSSVDISGEFTSADEAGGPVLVDYFSLPYRCYYSGSWEAHPVIGVNGAVSTLLVQPDDKILVGGKFTEAGRETHNNLARLNPDGSLDSAFSPNFNGTVNALAVQEDGKILAAGAFSTVNGEAHAGIARLNPDGSLDSNFTTAIVGGATELALQSDGKILVGGWFSAVNDLVRNGLARLNTDGTLDESFLVEASYMQVYAVKVLSDDKILAGGYMENVSWAEWADYLVRLNADGSLDTGFQPDTGGWWVDGIAVQADGMILAGINGELARFDSTGTRDPDFTPPTLQVGTVRHIAVQPGIGLVVGGNFYDFGADSYDYLARLGMDGALDTAFHPAPNAEIYALAVQDDNKILVGGNFTQVNGEVRHGIVRLNADGSLDMTFSLLP